MRVASLRCASNETFGGSITLDFSYVHPRKMKIRAKTGKAKHGKHDASCDIALCQPAAGFSMIHFPCQQPILIWLPERFGRARLVFNFSNPQLA